MILRNGQPFDPSNGFTDENGVQYPPGWYRHVGPIERKGLGFTEVPDPEPVDPTYYVPTLTGEKVARSLEDIKISLRINLASKRWDKETAGIFYKNAIFATDPQSKTNYLAAVMQAQANSSYTVLWKAKSKDNVSETVFIDLKASDIIYLTNSGVDYITKAFLREEELLNQINAANSFNEIVSVDINAGWPSRDY